MTPKSGKAGSAVAPAAPKEAKEADTADPGEVAEVKARQREIKEGKYGSEKVKPFKPPTKEEVKAAKQAGEELTWIEIELVDANDKPVTGEKYKIELLDGRVQQGTTGSDGTARVDGIPAGSCKISFPERDASSWARA